MVAATRMPWIIAVALTHEGDACLPWPFSTRGGRRPQDAYPALMGCYAHVWLCTEMHGPKPSPDHEVEHLCGDHLCMNWRHLEWALHVDNCARRTEHGTQTIGERHGMAVLTAEQAAEILASNLPGVELARLHGVCPATISKIRNRILWKHLARAT